jgi:hypothetical protein
LHVDDDLRFAEFFRQLAYLAAQLLVFLRQWITRGFAPALARLQGLQNAVGAFTPPTR